MSRTSSFRNPPLHMNRLRLPWMCRRRNAAWRVVPAFLLALAASIVLSNAEEKKIQTSFPVKYVSADAVYLIGGSDSGLAEGQKLTVRHKETDGSADQGTVVGQIEIESVASVSAVGKIVSPNSGIVAGDVAYLATDDIEKLRTAKTAEEASTYPQVASFNTGDPPEQEVRDHIPRPPSPEVNRIRGRIAVDYGSLQQGTGGMSSSEFGYTLRIDASRLAGTYWGLNGFYQGRVFSQSEVTPQVTFRDLINRTYTLNFSYNNPNSPWVAGIGRLYVPWASSLDTIDGFYIGHRYGRATIGGFGGTTPDPTSWNYNKDREIAGAFVNFTGGSFDSLRYTTTSGLAISRISWHPDRQFGFFENQVSYKRSLSVYSDFEADFRDASQTEGQSGLTFSRSYVTVRYQPMDFISFDVNENYFRNLPTFDVRLIDTGLLDRYLFQGVSGGVRLQLPYRVGIYTTLGRSSRSGDTSPSWNYLYGGSVGNILHSGIRADFRYSKFDSSFGTGNYKSLTVGRGIGEKLTFDVQVGQENIDSSFTSQTRARFINGDLQWLVHRNYFLGAGITAYRSLGNDYNQYFLSLGYRFDLHRPRPVAMIH